jgi:hypothetical protein
MRTAPHITNRLLGLGLLAVFLVLSACEKDEPLDEPKSAKGDQQVEQTGEGRFQDGTQMIDTQEELQRKKWWPWWISYIWGNGSNLGATGGSLSSAQGVQACGTVDTIQLTAGKMYDAGNVLIYNDKKHFYLSVQLKQGWQAHKSYFYAGKCGNMPVNPGGQAVPGFFTYINKHHPATGALTYRIPKQNLDSCFCISYHAILSKNYGYATAWAEGQYFSQRGQWSMYSNQCLDQCNTCSIQSGDFATYTQRLYNAPGRTGNTYLRNNFSKAFPNGLQLSCAGGKTLKFTSAQSVLRVLPGRRPGVAISKNMTDPTNYDSRFGGSLIALALNLGFDYYDPQFSSSNTQLGELVITQGPFKGWTVDQLYDEAKQALAGCGTQQNTTDLGEALRKVNRNFKRGATNKGYLKCP